MRYISGRPETRDETVAVIDRGKNRWTESDTRGGVA
jgi:hypothetical protein